MGQRQAPPGTDASTVLPTPGPESGCLLQVLRFTCCVAQRKFCAPAPQRADARIRQLPVARNARQISRADPTTTK